MGISHRNGGRTRHFDWGRHETTPDIASNSDKPTSQHSLDENRVYSVLLYCLASHPIQFGRRSYTTPAFWERLRSVVQVHPGPPFKSPVNTRLFSLFPFPRIFLKKPICELFANFRIGQRTQCREIHGVDLLVATVRPRFQPPPKARYSPTRLVVTDV